MATKRKARAVSSGSGPSDVATVRRCPEGSTPVRPAASVLVVPGVARELAALTVDELRDRVAADHEQAARFASDALNAANDAVHYACKAGAALLEAKARLGHGKWLPWLKAVPGIGERQAQRYMELARRAAESGHVPALRSIEGALAALTCKPARGRHDRPKRDGPAAADDPSRDGGAAAPVVDRDPKLQGVHPEAAATPPEPTPPPSFAEAIVEMFLDDTDGSGTPGKPATGERELTPERAILDAMTRANEQILAMLAARVFTSRECHRLVETAQRRLADAVVAMEEAATRADEALATRAARGALAEAAS